MKQKESVPLTRKLIGATGLELLRRGGPREVSTRKVARELGVSAMALYPHVGNKEGLLDAIKF